MGIKADPEDVGVLTRYVQDKHPTKEEKWFSITRFFSLTLSVEDPAMNRQLVASYTKNGLRAEALRGENMARQVRMMHPNTPSDEIECFITCLNIYWVGKRTATLFAQSSERRGNIDWRAATLLVTFH